MTRSGRAAETSRMRAGASNTSTTTASTPTARSASALAVERVVPTIWCPALRSSGTSRLPMAPVAPARNIRMLLRSHLFLQRLRQIGGSRSFGRHEDRQQRCGLGCACIARDTMHGARRLPPGLAGAKDLLGPIIDFGG